MSFRDEMSAINGENQYAFSQSQVEACADELYAMIQRDLKAEVAAGRVYPGGLFGTKRYVACNYEFWKSRLVLPKTPYLREKTSGGVNPVFYDWKEVSALIKALKARAVVDDITIRKRTSADDTTYGDGYGNSSTNVYVQATYVL